MPEAGFSKIKIIVLVVAVALTGVAGAILLTMKNDTSNSSVTASPGSTKSVDGIAEDEASDEDAIDNSFASQDQDSVDATDKAADSIGGAYDDSDL